jgi:ubiquinone biosynthesis protein
MNWEWLLNDTNLSELLPDVYAHYRKPLKGALTLFLDGLPDRRQEAIAREQSMLPLTATASQRLVLLARNCPVLHKLGQTLARDRNLSAELRSHLQQLESLPPITPLEAVEAVLRQELGPIDRLGIRLMPPALAEASVAVVVPFRLTRGTVHQDGVFKVLKPEIEEHLDQELNILAQVGSFLDQRCDDLKIPHLDYRDSFEKVREKLQCEVRLDKEQLNLSLARDIHKGDPRVHIPALFEFRTRRVTAMEQVTGKKVTECCLESPVDNRRIARLVIEALIARPIFSTASQASFHGDPHAGNLFSTGDRRLAILDWSLLGSLGEQERVSIMQILLGAMALRPERIVSALSGLSSSQSIDLPALKSVVNEWIGRTIHGQLPKFRWLIALLDEAVQKARLRFGADLMLFRKTIHMVEGVVEDIVGESRLIDQVLLSEFLLHFSAEWPWRFFIPPDSHAFATRLSNMDLAELMLSFSGRAI